LNIAYGKSFREKLDIYGDDLPADSPLFVFIHGGYWQMCSKWESAFLVKTLVEKGVRVILVEYDLCPTVTLQKIVSQVQEAFKWTSEYVKENSIKSVSFSGHSAGGHLLATSLTKEFIESIASDVKMFTYFISGVYDLTELRHLKAANENNILSLDDNNYRQLSPQFNDFSHLLTRNITHFICVGEFESEKFKEQSKDFAEKTFKNIQNVKYKVIKDRDHFDIVEKLLESDYELTKLILSNSLK
jgi:arylformamidase